MAHYEEKEGFKNITEVRNFLYGTNNRKNSKVYLNIEQHNGHNYLCIWLDNKLTLDEITGDQKYLDSINGFKKHYELKMNKVDYEDVYYTEAVQDITTIAVAKVDTLADGYDSRELYSLCRDWAKEFENWWNNLEDTEPHDYMLDVEEFAEKKVTEYIERKYQQMHR